MEKLWPALEHIDSSSGALGTAVDNTVYTLLPLIINAPADTKTRDQWLDRLWQAIEEDGVSYLALVGDQWGELCGSVETAAQWADQLTPILKSCWNSPDILSYFNGTTACLSSLLAAGRYQELLDLLESKRAVSWAYRRYGVKALLAMGKKSKALQYAEASRRDNQPNVFIDQVCEEILISSGLHQEAYQRYGLRASERNSYLAWFRAAAKRYPMIAPTDILADLIKSTPGREGKWFATAKELKLYELALQLANQSPCDPNTLTRAARDFYESEPEFAFGAALTALRWLNEGWGYEATGINVTDAYNLAMKAAERLPKDKIYKDVLPGISALPDRTESPGNEFIRQSLAHILGPYEDTMPSG